MFLCDGDYLVLESGLWEGLLPCDYAVFVNKRTIPICRRDAGLVMGEIVRLALTRLGCPCYTCVDRICVLYHRPSGSGFR